MNDSRMMGKINNLEIPLVSRREVNILELKEKLIKFDIMYFHYITNLIKLYMPYDFLETNDLILSTINYFNKYKEQLEEWNKSHK